MSCDHRGVVSRRHVLAGVEHAQRIDAGFGETVAESKGHPLRFPQPRRWRRVRTLQCPIASGALFDYAGRGPPDLIAPALVALKAEQVVLEQAHSAISV
ncbi:hypothetical protein Bcep1808_6061 [Burkholderia vietnamiensis G4]|uniref:Uncharacterized protein n=1 Tax=Burkholderia vietnamiensis (strain G4 / LMG 22486) TaxID=269482 RepID=A4JRT0_BURVG|nr:hypothetical protein Bcep1808_6061 [Burkholderia vietnamiensis G4]